MVQSTNQAEYATPTAITIRDVTGVSARYLGLSGCWRITFPEPANLPAFLRAGFASTGSRFAILILSKPDDRRSRRFGVSRWRPPRAKLQEPDIVCTPKTLSFRMRGLSTYVNRLRGWTDFDQFRQVLGEVNWANVF